MKCQRVKSDYLNLKQLTENASHELMTPLAVVTTKLDTLIQDETLTSEQFVQITDIYTSIKKSTRLNQSLMLLTKLENNLVPEDEEIEVGTIILFKLEQFQELIQAKELTVNYEVGTLPIKASGYLFEILINNLYTNAIRHNLQKGHIEINLSGKQMIFKNMGIQEPLSTKLIFQRFHKSQQSQGMGLGLTLVKYICQHYNYALIYSFENKTHIFTVKFQ
jgi:signal transduction histidine kinase